MFATTTQRFHKMLTAKYFKNCIKTVFTEITHLKLRKKPHDVSQRYQLRDYDVCQQCSQRWPVAS